MLLAKRQKVLEAVHQLLYCDTSWREDEIYGRRFARILERIGLSGNHAAMVDEELVIEYRKRVEGFLHGRETIDKSLIYFRIISTLFRQGMVADDLVAELEPHDVEGALSNLSFLEKGRFIEKINSEYRLTGRTRKLLIKLL